MIYNMLFPIQDFLQLYNVISDWTPGEDSVISFRSKVHSSLATKSVFLRWNISIFQFAITVTSGKGIQIPH